MLSFNNFEYLVTSEKITIVKYTGNESEVIVPEVIDDKPVTEIGKRAFYENHELKTVYIPESIEIIEDLAFHCCSSLEKITIMNPNCKIIDIDEVSDIRGYKVMTTICNKCWDSDIDHAIYSSWFGMVHKDKSCFYGTIYGHKGSIAEEYAKGFCEFKSIDEE